MKWDTDEPAPITLRFPSPQKYKSSKSYLPVTGIIAEFEVERPPFSHVSRKVPLLEVTNVILLSVTTTPFVLDLSVSTAKPLKPLTLRNVDRVSPDVNSTTLLPLAVHERALEFPAAQVQVTVSPRHTDCLSHVTEVSPSIKRENNMTTCGVIILL